MFLAESYEDLLATAIINKVNIEVLLIARELLNIFFAQVGLLIKENMSVKTYIVPFITTIREQNACVR